MVFEKKNSRRLILTPKKLITGYSMRGVVHKLLSSYLSDRKQRVAIYFCVSSYKSALHRVPQGSVLGPLLFNIYVNDVVKISSDASFIPYVDDTSHSFQIGIHKKCLQKLKRNLKNFIVGPSQTAQKSIPVNPRQSYLGQRTDKLRLMDKLYWDACLLHC